MIPMLARIRIRSGSTRFGFWAPLFLLWLLLLPLAIVLAPFFVIYLLIVRVHPLRAMADTISVVWSLAGTQVSVRTPTSDVFIRLI
jgi:hypothetical protein